MTIQDLVGLEIDELKIGMLNRVYHGIDGTGITNQ